MQEGSLITDIEGSDTNSTIVRSVGGNLGKSIMTYKEAYKKMTKVEIGANYRGELTEEEKREYEEAMWVMLEALRDCAAREQKVGCEDCAYLETEEWNMPCYRCIRSCKDYWREKS